MQLKWKRSVYGYWIETNVFDIRYSIRLDLDGTWVVTNANTRERLTQGFKTAEEAMVAAHRIIEKELEKGYVGADPHYNSSAKLGYTPEDMFGCKKALALFTNENGDEYIDSVLISATIPKGSLVREVDPKHHYGLPDNLCVCRKCRSDRAVIVDILPPLFVRAGESTNLSSRKTQRKKISIISVHAVTEAIRMHVIAQEDLVYGYMYRRIHHRDESTIMRKLMQEFISIILGFNKTAHIFIVGELLSKIAKPAFPASLELTMVARLLDPYKDIIDKYQNDILMLCKVLLARVLRDIGIMDIALRQSYKIGDKIQIDDFDLSNNACGAGFHFFKTAIEAWNYKFN